MAGSFSLAGSVTVSLRTHTGTRLHYGMNRLAPKSSSVQSLSPRYLTGTAAGSDSNALTIHPFARADSGWS